MSTSFRLRYLLGLIPTAQKIDQAWTELFGMRNELHLIETSKELARYEELKHIVESSEFQTKKRMIISLNFSGSSENQLLTELSRLEKSKPIKNYFKFKESSDYQRINNVLASSDLVRYLELKKIIEVPEFFRRKRMVESLRYKGSPEYVKRQEYNSLEKSTPLKRYNATLVSDQYRLFLDLQATGKEMINDPAYKKDPKVKNYHQFLNSRSFKNLKDVEKIGLPARLEKLKQQIGEQSFLEQEIYLQNPNRYETSPDYPEFSEFTRLSKDSEIQFYLKCIHSSIYTNYRTIEKSKELVRLKDMRLQTEDQAFKLHEAFLKNKKRYETTPEFKLEAEFSELGKSKIITTYHQLKKRPELAFFEHWEVMLDENFSHHQLNDTLWEPENYWGSRMAGYSFSQADELQAYKGMKNIEIKNQVLSIITKAEKSEGKVWVPSVGLIPRNFDYSSGHLNTGNGFSFIEGAVEAKVKFSAEGGLTSAFSLTGSQPFPQIDVFRSGPNRVGLGIIDQPEKNGAKKLVQIKGLNFSNFHIFRLEYFGKLLVWKINNQEVHREHIPTNIGELFLNFTGSLHQPLNGGSLPHHFEIDWVRCLRRK
ncbi:MAG: hypothetical protein WCL21_12890 [Mariniphaga sp.]